MVYFNNHCFVSGSALVLDNLPPLPVTMSNYPVPPPAYGPASTQQNSKYQSDNSHEPLLASSSRGGAGGVYDQPDQRDLPDDFKVRQY